MPLLMAKFKASFLAERFEFTVFPVILPSLVSLNCKVLSRLISLVVSLVS